MLIKHCQLFAMSVLCLSLTACSGGGAGTQKDGYQPYHLARTYSRPTLTRQNLYRQRQGIRKLTWNPQLAQRAQSWANYLRDNKGCAMIHSKAGSQRDKNEGENLFLSIVWHPKKRIGPIASNSAAADDWYREKPFYNAGTGKCQGGVCGHYKQMMWRDTRQVGCGVAQCIKQQDKMWYVREIWVCRYSPIGNWPGKRAY